MVKIIWAFIVGLALIALIIFALNNLTTSRANLEYSRGQARAMIIEAQGQARLDSAQAAAVTSNAALPWLIVFSILSLAIVAVVFFLKSPPRELYEPPARIIERQTVFILQPGQSRRELYRLMSNLKETPLLMGDNVFTKTNQRGKTNEL